MRYGTTIKATNFMPHDWRIKLTKAVFFFIPAANPDTEILYPKIKKWVLEVDDDGAPIREVALDEKDGVLFRAPDGRNMGFWTDEDVTFAATDLTSITADQFEDFWAEAKPS